MLKGMRREVVTGLGQVTPHGSDVAAGFEALLAGHSAIRLNTVGEAPHALTLASAVCEGADAAARLGRARVSMMDRVSQLSALAGTAAWADACLDGLPETAPELERACALWGTGAGGMQTLERGYRDLSLRERPRVSPLSVVMGMHNAAASQLALLLGLGGACLSYSVACASSSVAIAEGMRRVQRGECELALAGGGEAALPYGAVKAWPALQVLAPADGEAAACRPFDASRRGLVLGEGAAALVLEERERALSRGARIYAELAGSGASCDHHHLTSPEVGGQLRALRAALRDAAVDAQDVRHVNAHGTATVDGDPVEAEALRQLFGAFAPRVAVSATKSMHGHLMGAAGAPEALVCVMAVHTGHIPPTAHLQPVDTACDGLDHVRGVGRRGVGVPLALSNSFAFGGSNSVLVFRRHESG